MEKLLTKKEVAERWKVTPRAVENWVRDGKLTPCKTPGDIRFNAKYIESLEGMPENPMSPQERRRLLQEMEAIKRERDELRDILNELDLVMAKARYNRMK